MKKPIDKISEPLVSIITPFHNAAHFLEQTLNSVQAQTYDYWEHILVNDASTDGSLDYVKERANNDARLKIINLSQNRGAAYARNKATAIARGDFIAFLDADDLWHPEKLEKQLNHIKKNGHTVSFTSYVHINKEGSEIGKRVVALPQLTFKKQHQNNYIGNLTGIYNAQVLGKIRTPNIRKRQDWALWLEAIKRSNSPALGLTEDLAYYRISEDSISADKKKLVKYNYLFYRKYLGYSPFKSMFWLGRFFLEYFFVRPKHIEKY